MARRLPSTLSYCLRSCQLYRNGQTCYDCPNRGMSTCPLPDIEDLYMAKPHANEMCEQNVSAPRVVTKVQNVAVSTDNVDSTSLPTVCTEALAAVSSSLPSAPLAIRSEPVPLTAAKPPSIARASAKLGMFGNLTASVGCTYGIGSIVGRLNSLAGLSSSAISTSKSTHNAGAHVSLRDIPGLQKLIISKTLACNVAAHQSLLDKPVPLSSDEGKELFTQALASGGLENYFTLSEQYLTQMDPSIAAVSSLAMVLNALNHDPRRTWKGPWRWNTEEVVQCSGACGHSLDSLRQNGIAFSELVAMARCQGVRAQPFSTAASGLESEKLAQFRRDVISVCGDPASHRQMIVNFSRAALNQDGNDGHFSPLGGYNAEKDMVLILDVDRYRSPPFWVSLSHLWDAMASVDMKSGTTRGYVILSTWTSTASSDLGNGLASLCPLMIRSWGEHKRGGNCCKRHRHAHRRANHRKPVRPPPALGTAPAEGGVVPLVPGRAPVLSGQTLTVAGCGTVSEGRIDMVVGRSRMMHTSRIMHA